MLSVEEAVTRIASSFKLLPPEQVSLASAHGRVLAENLISLRSHPAVDVSSMDGYAVIASDIKKTPIDLKVVGYVPAGDSYQGTIITGQACRIFTGAPIPTGANAIVIQENTKKNGNKVTVNKGVKEGQYIRRTGMDFKYGDIGLYAGQVLSARDLGYAAAMNYPWLMVRRRPRIAILATGDEVVMPGNAPSPNQVISSNTIALGATITALGGEAIHLGISPDNRKVLRNMIANAHGNDLLVTTGGVSVGDLDLVHGVLTEAGFELDFWKIAMRPGKPLMFGKFGSTPIIGLPGNPVSTLVCALVFIKAAMQAMLGFRESHNSKINAKLGCDLKKNDHRQDFLRAKLSYNRGGDLVATPFSLQDSAMIARLAQADCLIVRPPNAPATKVGENVEILRIGYGLLGV